MPEQAVTRKPYTSDLSDAQWEVIEPLIPVWTVGRPRETDMREVVNAIFYLLTNGCGWRNLPHDFPPEGTVRDHFHRWQRLGQKSLTVGPDSRHASGKGPRRCRSGADAQCRKPGFAGRQGGSNFGGSGIRHGEKNQRD